MGYVYIYDNNTGRDIIPKIDIYPVSLLLGSSLDEVHNQITDKAKLFCVFTNISGMDFIVTNKLDADRLRDILTFGKYDYKVDVVEQSIWYSDKANKNIIISGTVKIPNDELAKLLGLFISSTESYKKNTAEMYEVYNERNGNSINRTPIYSEAVSICDANPCSVVKKKSTGDIIYRSKFGKVAIPYTNEPIKKKATTLDARGRVKFILK